MPVTRGGRKLMRARLNLTAAGLTQEQWRERWDAARLFLTADGERHAPWGNYTIAWNPDEGWLEVNLPTPLAYLGNRPHGRYRLSCEVRFQFRGDEVAAQAATGAVRYDICLDPARGRWYLDASWKSPAHRVPPVRELRAAPVVAVDVNAGHLAVAVLASDGNLIGVPFTIRLPLAGLPATARDGRVRAAVSQLIAGARQAGARAVVIEDLDFARAREQGREETGNRPARGRRGRRFRRHLAGIPTARFRDRLVQMTANAGLSVVVVDPAYTSRWGSEHWLAPLREHHPETHRPPRCGAGDRETRPGPPGRAPREREPCRPGGRGTASPGATPETPGSHGRTKETRRPTRHPAATTR